MDRRGFLKSGLAGLTSTVARRSVCASPMFGFSSAALSLAYSTYSTSAQAATAIINLSAFELSKAVSATKNVLTWQLVDLVQQGPGALSAGVVVRQGDNVVINLQNSLSAHSIKLKIPGIDNANWPVLQAGASGIYEFTAIQAGSYVIYDEANGLLGRAMGLAIPLIVLPVSIRTDAFDDLYNAAPLPHAYQREYTLMMSEMDSRINDAVQAGLPVDMTSYQPDYFFVNGLSYPDTVYDVNGVIDDSKVIYMLAGEQVAIRFINGGLIYYPMHFHGYHANIVLHNRRLERSVIEKDTILVKPQETIDCILHVGTQTGLYPLHTHYVPGVTTEGKYAGGGLLMMKAV